MPWPNRYLVSPDVAKEEAPEAYEEWQLAKAAEEADEETDVEVNEDAAEETAEESGDETAAETESVESDEEQTNGNE